jgi:hypothetical protein
LKNAIGAGIRNKNVKYGAIKGKFGAIASKMKLLLSTAKLGNRYESPK